MTVAGVLRGLLPQFTETARQSFFALVNVADKCEKMTKALLADYDVQNIAGIETYHWPESSPYVIKQKVVGTRKPEKQVSFFPCWE
jgi:hypothetical protein